MTVTIDASVFVAEARVEEVHYSASRSFLTEVRQQDIAAVCPALILPEVGAAIARRTDNSSLATNSSVKKIFSSPLRIINPPPLHSINQADTNSTPA